VIILGLNAWHGDASACVVRDGVLVAAAEEERFRRVKHWAGLPTEAAAYCLRAAGVGLAGVDVVAVNRDPHAHLLRKAWQTLRNGTDVAAVRSRLSNAAHVAGLGTALESALGAEPGVLDGKVRRVEHHLAHLASAYFVSPFREAAVVSVDGFGDFVSTMWGEGEGGRIRVHGAVHFPHSLGLFYLAMTQYLGFPKFGDEYKVMGLAPYGVPNAVDALRRVLRVLPGGRFALGLEHFRHHTTGVRMLWDGGEPTIAPVYSAELTRLLGPARRPDEPLEARHHDLAASTQALYEEAFFNLLAHVEERTGARALCLAGGCAMNSVANGKVRRRTPFAELYVQPAAGDAGGAVGAAFWVWNQELGRTRAYVMEDAYLGPGYADEEVAALLASRAGELRELGCEVEHVADEGRLCALVAAAIAGGAVVGWFQGRMEWGPRALGNRSILADPRRADMKDVLNHKIKRRESFRPFAPSVLRERAGEWFEADVDVPFMLEVLPVREEKRALVPAVTHVDGSGRLQTVTEAQNPRYHRLIRAFADATGVPMLLNTSFNENEPVVCRPEEALECFLRTKMDLLVLGDRVVRRLPS
jgi:carbamoyltransferase